MYRLLDLLLRRLVRAGDLKLIDAQGRWYRYGEGNGPLVVARITDKRLELRLLLDPHLALGEGYMNGQLRGGTREPFAVARRHAARNVQSVEAPAGDDMERYRLMPQDVFFIFRPA